MIKYVWASVLILVFSCANAQSSEKLFQDQVEIFSSVQESEQNILALSALKKINGVWLAEREELIAGTSIKKSYEIGSRFSLDTAWRVLQNYFLTRPAELLFECVGLDCGSSNAWANEVFDVKQLYGRDVSQHYQVWQDGDQFVRVYLVQRGNKRIYYLLEMIEPSTPGIKLIPAADAIAKKLYAEQRLKLQGVSYHSGELKLDAAYIAAYAKALNQQPFRKISVVVSAGPTVDKAQVQHLATSVEEALALQGVQRRRFVPSEGEEKTTAGKNNAQPDVFIILVQ